MKFNKKKLFIYILIIFILGFTINVNAANPDTLQCDSWEEVRNDFQNVFNFCKIAIPLLIIGLSTIDFIKALAGKDERDLKKSFFKLLKRLALAIVFFFLPVLLNFFLELMGTGASVCVN